MSDESSFRIEREVREPSDAEAARVRALRDGWHAAMHRSQVGPWNELWAVIAIGGVGAAIFGIVRGHHVLIVVAAIVALVLAAIVAWLRHKSRASLAATKGPWDLPSGWKVCETRVVARSVVGAAGGDEDYMLWFLFEIPGGDWFFVEPSSIPAPGGDDLARADLRITAIHPMGRYLAAEGTGERLPHHGVTKPGDEYAEGLERGLEWRPSDAQMQGQADGRVPEATLPRWVRDLTAR